MVEMNKIDTIPDFLGLAFKYIHGVFNARMRDFAHITTGQFIIIKKGPIEKGVIHTVDHIENI